MKVVAWLTGLATFVASGGYMVVSLNRWEWNRALFFGLLMLIAEIGLGIGLVLRKLAQMESSRKADPAVTAILRDTRPPSADRFRWLKDSHQQTNVFITFLVGGGVVVSAIAWVVDRIASTTSTPAGEARLARRLLPISYPSGGLVVDDVTALAQEVPGDDDAPLRKLLRHAGHT